MSAPRTPDRFITAAMMLTLALETAGALVWAGTMQSRVASLEAISGQTLPINIRLTRLEEQVAAAVASLDRIEADIQNLEAKPDD